MKTEKIIFTILPLFAVLAGIIGALFEHDWLIVVAAICCLPVLFYCFVVKTNFLFAILAIPLSVIGAFVHDSWYGGAALWYIGWSFSSIVYTYIVDFPNKRKENVREQSTKTKQTIEDTKSSYKFDISDLSLKSAVIRFKRSDTNIANAVSKIGGQPVWIEVPRWPISKSTGKPMQFIGQIRIDESLFGTKKAKMAYIFYSGDEEQTWDMDSDENAVILQPGDTDTICLKLAEGPILTTQEGARLEFHIETNDSEDSRFAPDCEQRQWSDKELQNFKKTNFKTKLGGTPYFLQGDEFPCPGKWCLLLQIKESDFPLNVNFGTGCAYAFINSDGTKAKFLWQR